MVKKDVGLWVKRIGMSQYASSFVNAGVVGSELLTFTCHADLVGRVGIESHPHRSKILRRIGKLRRRHSDIGSGGES